jgi:hypothetical protein
MVDKFGSRARRHGNGKSEEVAAQHTLLNSANYKKYQVADRSPSSGVIDTGRAEVMLNCMEPSSFETDSAQRDLVTSLCNASNNNPSVLELLINFFRECGEFDNDPFVNRVRRLWNSAADRTSNKDSIETLRSICNAEFLPESMVHALFDDPSFDFNAYLRDA